MANPASSISPPASNSSSWMLEKSSLWKGQTFGLEVETCLIDIQSAFQRIQCFQSSTYGRVLVLDGIIQCTERDECAYQEMLAHIGLFSHPNPKDVLIIGGGDGGIVREVCRHAGVQRIDLCEIDEKVVEVAKQFLPTMAHKLEDPRVHLHFRDGVEFLKNQIEAYDVILVDSSDPVGPAVELFEAPFYEAIQKALRKDGVAITQAECMWIHKSIISSIYQQACTIYPSVHYSSFSIPTYPCGCIGILCCSKSQRSCKQPVREDQQVLQQLQYYTPQLHEASFVLPAFMKNIVNSSN